MTEIGLGLAALGRPAYINVGGFGGMDVSKAALRTRALDVMDKAYKLGIRRFDMSPGYGAAEEFALEWIESRSHVDVKFSTKWGYTYVGAFDPTAQVHELKEHSLKKLNEQWEYSRRLAPQLDVYQIHSATFDTGVLKNEIVLSRLADIRANTGVQMGLSTTGVDQKSVIEVASQIEYDGVVLFNWLQSTYNVLDRSIERMGKYWLEDGRHLIVKEALANGRIFGNNGFENHRNVSIVMADIGRKYNIGIDAVGLAFAGQSLGVDYVLSGASNFAHLESNIKAKDLTLSQDDMNVLNNLDIEASVYWKERKKLAWN